jgi:hypothetical protein
MRQDRRQVAGIQTAQHSNDDRDVVALSIREMKTNALFIRGAPRAIFIA